MITNPVLPGFNPDPSILRIGDDYYIATSTFEWFPGVQIHHSRDLVHWRLLTRPLTRLSQLDMRGTLDSCGVWAPCLSHDGKLFYLIYTNMRRHWPYMEAHNYLVTAPAITGPWSEPVYLNSSGFDPSLFHDDDGRKWLVNMLHDFRPSRNMFGGIVLQEYSSTERKLVGPIRNIFTGTPLGSTEGPHLYRKEGWYYLLCAEGGTAYEHAVTLTRSRAIEGPYEVDPQNPMLTASGHPELALQKAGHASLVQTQTGDWYLAHLCGRPRTEHRRCMLGREASLQKCVWSADGWLRLAGGGNRPQVQVPAPADLAPHPFPAESERDDFNTSALNIHFQSLRVPIEESWCSLTARPGWLCLIGRESPRSLFEQSLIARRIQHFDTDVTTCIEFDPESYQQMAGLLAIYNTSNHVYLRISHHEKLGKHLGILVRDRGAYVEDESLFVALPSKARVFLRGTIKADQLQFAWSLDGVAWQAIGPAYDASQLSDEYCDGCFTGAFWGLGCHDMSGRRVRADFDFFDYRT